MPQHAQRPGKGNKGKGSKQRQDALSPFLAPLTAKTFKKELHAERHAAFAPQQHELRGEVRAEKAYRPRIRDYFANYGDAVQKAATTDSGAYSDAVAKATAAGASASATDSAVRDKIETAAKADAELRGATYTPNQTSVDASANRGDSAAMIAAVIAGQGANQQAYLADKSRIGQGELRDQLLRSHARSRALDSDKRDIATSKRDYTKDYFARTRESERSYALSQQQLAQTAKGQKLTAKTSRKNAKLSAQTSAANAALSSATSRRGQDLTAQSNAEGHQIARGNLKARRKADRYARRHPNAGDAHPHDGGSGKNVQAAVADVRYYASTHDKKLSPQQYIDYLVQAGYPRSIAVDALSRLTGTAGHTSPNAATHGG